MSNYITPARPLFGPSGSPESFAAEGHTSTAEMPAWLRARGLDVYEYSFGRGVRLSDATAAKIGVRGKTLCLYLALNPADFEDSKFRFEDVSDKKTHAAVPMKVRITSRRALKHAQELLKILAEKYELQEVGTLLKEYKFPYETDDQLIEDGLIKPYTVLVKKKKKS